MLMLVCCLLNAQNETTIIPQDPATVELLMKLENCVLKKGECFLSHLKMVMTSHPDAENCAYNEKGGHCYCADNSAVIHNLFIFKLVILFVCKGTPIMESTQTMVMTYQASFTAAEADCSYRKTR